MNLRSRHNRASRRRHARAFTLVELVVVVGIIIALLSLVLAVSTLLIQQNEARQLEAAYANLDRAVQEYELAIGRPIAFQDRIDVVDPALGVVVDTIRTGNGPFGMAYVRNPELGIDKLYVALFHEQSVGVIELDPASPYHHTVVAEIR